MVFVHGLGGTWQNWLLNIPAFMGSHRVIAPDLPGFGESPMPREEISIKGYARILDGLLDALGVDSAVVVGNSMGGFVAAELALSFPTRVERLVLVSAAGLSIEEYRPRRRCWSARGSGPATATWLGARGRLGRHAAAGAAARAAADRALPGEALARSSPTSSPAAPARRASCPRWRRCSPTASATTSRGSRSPRWSCGAATTCSSRAATRASTCALIGDNARREMFEDTGHLSMVERPTRFNRLLEAFAAGRARARGRRRGRQRLRRRGSGQ